MITSLEVYRYRLPFRGDVRIGSLQARFRTGICIRLIDGAIVGWGEAAPLAGLSSERDEDVARELIRLRDMLPAFGPELLANLDAPSARFALDTALHEVRARRDGLDQLVAPTNVRHSYLHIAGLRGDVEGTVDLAEPSPAAIKIKVGADDWQDDVRRVEAIRAAEGPEVRLRLDANRSWNLTDAEDFLSAVSGIGIDYIEEPVRLVENLGRLNTFGIDVALDETLHELVRQGCSNGHALVQQAVDRVPSASVLVLKPSLIGDWGVTLDLFGAAHGKRRRVVVSSAYESGLGLRAVIALASQNPFSDPPGLDPYRRLASDLIHPRLPFGRSIVDTALACSLDARVLGERMSPWLDSP